MATQHNTQYQTPIETLSNEDLAIVEGQKALIFNSSNGRYEGWNGSSWAALAETPESTAFQSRIIVNQENVATTLGGLIDSGKEYFLDGVIDMSGVTIEVPAGGVNIKGFDFDVSKMVCSDPNYTMFTSPVGGSGNVLGIDYAIEVTGSNSKVYALESATGFDAFEFSRINYNNCASLGYIDGYRQGLETGTGRFGGSPSLELRGNWNGFRITTSIVRVLSSSMTEPLFKAGAGFSMSARFLTDINCDLPNLAAFMDFAPSNFPNPSTLQVKGAIFTRNGATDATDSNIFSNIDKSDLSSDFTGNRGVGNTFEGGRLTVSSENLTNISAGSTWYDINAIWSASNLEHYDSPSSGQLRHLGDSPREYRCNVNFVIESTANNDLGIRLRKWDNSSGSFVDFSERKRQVNSLVGGRDVAIFNFSFNISLDKNDYVYFQVRNNSGNSNVTLELNSDWILEQR